MIINQLKIQNVRNLGAVSIEPHRKVSIFFGDNGSGKTSLLESIHLLGLGKSFRTHISKKLIRFGESSAIVHANLLKPDYLNEGYEMDCTEPSSECFTSLSPDYQVKVGIEKRVDGTSTCKVAGEKQPTISGISTILPIQVFGPDVEDLIDGASKSRRSFLDWGVFHVEHNFLDTWKSANQILKQRNALLRIESQRRKKRAVVRTNHSIETELDQWDQLLAPLGEQISRYRKDYLESLFPIFEQLLSIFDVADFNQADVRYQRGWSKDLSLLEALRENRESDLKKGHTSYGYHRANLDFRVSGAYARDILSRGQKKSFTLAIKIAQIKHLKEKCGKSCLLLLDDITSEIDSNNIERIISLIEEQDAQAFITTLTNEAITDKLGVLDEDFAMFHVEHGACTRWAQG